MAVVVVTILFFGICCNGQFLLLLYAVALNKSNFESTLKDWILNTVAGLPYTVNYHAVTAGPEPPLVVSFHARGRQG